MNSYHCRTPCWPYHRCRSGALLCSYSPDGSLYPNMPGFGVGKRSRAPDPDRRARNPPQVPGPSGYLGDNRNPARKKEFVLQRKFGLCFDHSLPLGSMPWIRCCANGHRHVRPIRKHYGARPLEPDGAELSRRMSFSGTQGQSIPAALGRGAYTYDCLITSP